MSLLEKAHQLVDKAKHAAGRVTGDRDTRHRGKIRQHRHDGHDHQDRISEAAQDAKDRYRTN